MSNLPDFNEVKDAIRLRIEQVNVALCPSENVRVAFDLVNGDRSEPASVRLYKIDDDRVNGHLPSKVLINQYGEPVLIFYVSSSLPAQLRPFEGQAVYVFLIEDVNATVEYDGELRVFIDQVVTPRGITYIVMFGESQLNEIVLKDV